ncbi:basic salivary proline-rich protein 2-like [Sphaeramia orbicularis]|uniref:basic salivary proline-rich protein 2-like n=1 Tax=Sphaeramia orbicularis TaxID=375764 RepID=UPI00117C11E7|nr:basic salivary proline-rich protein 2-like [Sphaeramia orbicularis]
MRAPRPGQPADTTERGIQPAPQDATVLPPQRWSREAPATGSKAAKHRPQWARDASRQTPGGVQPPRGRQGASPQAPRAQKQPVPWAGVPPSMPGPVQHHRKSPQGTAAECSPSTNWSPEWQHQPPGTPLRPITPPATATSPMPAHTHLSRSQHILWWARGQPTQAPPRPQFPCTHVIHQRAAPPPSKAVSHTQANGPTPPSPLPPGPPTPDGIQETRVWEDPTTTLSSPPISALKCEVCMQAFKIEEQKLHTAEGDDTWAASPTQMAPPTRCHAARPPKGPPRRERLRAPIDCSQKAATHPKGHSHTQSSYVVEGAWIWDQLPQSPPNRRGDPPLSIPPQSCTP